jgi:hypothetical protein
VVAITDCGRRFRHSHRLRKSVTVADKSQQGHHLDQFSHHYLSCALRTLPFATRPVWSDVITMLA